jgi:hypothetical protein
MPEKLNLAILTAFSDSFLPHEVDEQLILGVFAGVWVIHNTSSIAPLSLIGHRGIH